MELRKVKGYLYCVCKNFSVLEKDVLEILKTTPPNGVVFLSQRALIVWSPTAFEKASPGYFRTAIDRIKAERQLQSSEWQHTPDRAPHMAGRYGWLVVNGHLEAATDDALRHTEKTYKNRAV